MPKYTENYNLILPEQPETYNVDVANTNNKEIDSILENKVDKIPGKGLSTNDFTNEHLQKLNKIQNYNDKEVREAIDSLNTKQDSQSTKVEKIEKDLESIKSKNTEQDKNITDIQTEQTTQNESIEELKKESIELREENERLKEDLNNSTISGHNEGENITIEGSAEARFKKLKISGNSVQDGEPSPESPVEIRNCGNVNFGICNKNSFDISKIKNTSIITNNGDGTLTLSNNNNVNGEATTTIQFKTVVSNLKVGQKFILSFDTTFDNNSFKNNFYLINVDSSLQSKTIVKNHVYTATKEMLEGILIIYGGYNKVSTISNIQVEIVNSDESKGTEYVPHQEQNFSFPTKHGQVFHKGDYLADDGTHHVRNTYIFDGTENFSVHTTVNNIIGFRFTQLNSEPLEDLICTHFKNTTVKNYTNNREYGLIATVSSSELLKRNYIYISQPNKEIDTIDKLKAFFLEQYQNGTPVKLEYDLQEEIIEPYSEEQEAYKQIKNAKTYKRTTHIFCTDEISCEFEEEHLVDLETYINSKLVTTSADTPIQEHPSIQEGPNMEEPSIEKVGDEVDE